MPGYSAISPGACWTAAASKILKSKRRLYGYRRYPAEIVCEALLIPSYRGVVRGHVAENDIFENILFPNV
jgi:hypothetical protein